MTGDQGDRPEPPQPLDDARAGDTTEAERPPAAPLDALRGGRPAGAAPLEVSTQLQAYDPEREREGMRGRIAVALLAILGAAVLGAFLSLWFNWASADELDGILTLIFAPLIGLVGAVTGFYYGSRADGGGR